MQTKEKPKRSRFLPWKLAGIVLVIMALPCAYIVHRIHQLPRELMQDVRAGIAARGIRDPDQRFEKFLEGRYGSQKDPANQQKAFLGFFAPDHIRAMQLLVQHSPKDQRQANINAAAKWVQQYRDNLTSQQRTDLAAQLFSPQGRVELQQATTIYNLQDVHYRDQSQIVISQLLTTIARLKSQP